MNDFWIFVGLTLLVPAILWVVGLVLNCELAVRRDAERKRQEAEQWPSLVTLYRRWPYDWMEPDLDAGQAVEEAERIVRRARR